VAVAVWNGTLDQSKQEGSPELGRDVTLEVEGLSPGRYRLRHRRVDLEHSNVSAVAADLGVGAWPDARQWAELRRHDVLEDLEPAQVLRVGDDGRGGIAFHLPMPGVSFLELVAHEGDPG
jgi:xylan 1,4-beta-xylosidase